MIYLLDGSNILGQLGQDRHSDEAKRTLTRAAAALARSRKTKVICVFDGNSPSSFAGNLGALTVRFAGTRAADDLIADEAERLAAPLTVITSDSELAARVRRRRVEVISAREFVGLLGPSPLGPSPRGGEEEMDWEEYFSDSKNRNV